LNTYEERVNDALIKWADQTRGRVRHLYSFEQLVKVLAAYTASPEASSDAGARVTKNAWATVFTTYFVDKSDRNLEFFVLKSLLEHGRWRALCDSAETAHAFVSIVTGYIEAHDMDWNIELGDAIRTAWAEALSEWIGPTESVEATTLRAIAAALFGELWCVLVYDSRLPDESLAGLIAEFRPEFLPGRMTSCIELQAAHLPELV
jgi:hypothetical protein